ncbi:polyphosphate kinase 2 [Ferrovibrio terrae]|uniref:polyphosphate kinase 2 n=1 Tax=Ferrovibrio terrae TaxID=2594003 RepID=UPI001FE92CA4|nr:polyphosphate kinase 2 [Ferrovibrio terrae]
MSIARSSKKETTYRAALRGLQIELVRLQRHLIETGGRLLILLEGRDGAGKDGAIKAILEHMSPRESRAVALGKPSDREATQWYFQRYVPHLPAGGEFVLFNRSWYNRAGVEHVMGFCSQMAYEDFLTAVPVFEDMLIRDGVHLFKYYLDIDKAEQKRRLDARRKDPLKQWKISPIDEAALKHWKDYSRARDTMLSRTSTPASPWLVVRANDKRVARLNLIRDLLSSVEYKNKGKPGLLKPDRAIVFPFETKALADGRLSK